MITDIDTHEAMLEFYDICISKNACEPQMVLTRQAIADGWTLRQLIDNTMDNPDYASWARWLRTMLARELPKELRNTLTYRGLNSPKWSKSSYRDAFRKF